MKINVLTLFPDMFTPLQVSMLGRGLEDKKWELNLVNFRDFTSDVHLVAYTQFQLEQNHE